jgi:hypothetical protein
MDKRSKDAYDNVIVILAVIAIVVSIVAFVV